MTNPRNDAPAEEPEGTGMTGALGAASTDRNPSDDPLGPLDRITEDDGDSGS